MFNTLLVVISLATPVIFPSQYSLLVDGEDIMFEVPDLWEMSLNIDDSFALWSHGPETRLCLAKTI